MVAPRKIRCAVVAVTTDERGRITDSASYELEPRFRPSDLVPWADPYIASLVRKLQAEVRSDRRPVRSELEVPWTSDDFEAPAGDDAPATDAERWVREPATVG